MALLLASLRRILRSLGEATSVGRRQILSAALAGEAGFASDSRVAAFAFFEELNICNVAIKAYVRTYTCR